MNIQVAATMTGRVAAIGPAPVHGARHDAHAFAAFGLKGLLADHDTVADLGYTGVDRITIVPFRTRPGGELHESQTAFNASLSAILAAVERAVAHLKTWRRHRAVLLAITLALMNKLVLRGRRAAAGGLWHGGARSSTGNGASHCAW